MYTIHNHNVFDILPHLEYNSVDCIITSPPYWGLRDYNNKHQIGMEKSPNAYVRNIVKVTRLCKKILKKNGTLWLNLGDCYVGGKGMSGGEAVSSHKLRMESNKTFSKSYQNVGGKGIMRPSDNIAVLRKLHLKRKDLIGLPWRVALALQKDGWYLRNDIIWHKPNAMPESVKDRFTKTHEYLFLFSLRERYYFDKTVIQEDSAPGGAKAKSWEQRKQFGEPMRQGLNGARGIQFGSNGKKNKRTVWTVPTQTYVGEHFATFPPDLIEPCILAGCPEGGTILDPFAGSGTTGAVAEKFNRNSILIDINPEYCKMIPDRIASICSINTPKICENQLQIFD